jgi:type I restriction enzyme S subunit
MKAKKQNVPVLRFPGFVGEWKEKRLSTIAELTSSKRVHLSDYVHSGIPFFRGKEISLLRSSQIPDDVLYISEEHYEHIREKYGVPKIGDILITAVGTLGNVYRIRDSNEFYFKDGNLIWMKNILENPVFLEVLFDAKSNYVLSSAIGSSQKALTITELNKLKFVFPTKQEQKKIAAFLTAVDSKIEQLSKKKALLEQYKKGMMQKLFSQELRFKDEQGNEFPDWEEKRLKDCCQINPKTTELPAEFVYIDLESVANGVLLKENTILEANAPSRAQRLLSKSDVLFQTVRPYQKNNYYFDQDGNYVASTGYAQLRSQESALFLYQIIHTNSFVNRVMARCTGTSYPTINSRDLGEIPVLIPTVPEQRKIATFLSSIDKKITLISTELNHAQSFKKSLLQQMFV